MIRTTVRQIGFAVLALALLAVGMVALTGSASAASAGVVYTESNSSSGNAILVFQRATNGTLISAGSFSTGGTGTGVNLQTQGALVLTPNWIIAVNAGSNDVSVVARSNGQVLSRVSSGGTMPVSVTTNGSLVYVVNAGSNNISGFKLSSSGKLSPIANSTRPLSGSGVGPAEILFSSNGEVLVVTEKNTNLIDTYAVGTNGVATGPTTHHSNGATPFGFAFAPHSTLVVSEAAASAASSYHLAGEGVLQLISGSVVNGQAAACWVAIAKGQFAYTANAHNGTISSYTVGSNGSLKLLKGVAGAPGGGPLDEATSSLDQFLYVLNPSTGVINAFAINNNGSLTPLANTSGIPASATGLVAN